MKQNRQNISERMTNFLRSSWEVSKKNPFVFFVVLVYIVFIASSMGPSFTNCTDSIYGLGDSTAGPVWRNSIGQPPLGSSESFTNYPKGEDLYTPVNYVGLVQGVMFYAGSKVVGPVCSYNLSNIIGYLSTALVMFAFILYLTKSRWIALLAGYAVAFTPYIQSKIGGHPSYAYGSLLIAIIWLILCIIRERKRRHGILLAFILGICTYFDPYFILLAGTIMLPMLAVWAVHGTVMIRRDRSNKKDMLAVFRVFLVALGVFAVLATPLVVVRIKDADVITSSISAVRGSVLNAAQQCSNTPIDYILPDPLNTYLVDLLGQKYITHNIALRNWCGFGESRVAISLTMIATIALGVMIVVWERLNSRKLELKRILNYDPKTLFWGVGLIALMALLIGLPPVLGGMHMPSWWIIKITETWRIFAREYLVLNIAIVILFSIFLRYFSSIPVAKRHGKIVAVIFIGIFLLIKAEYRINAPFHPPSFSYSQNIPQVYYRIRDDKDINAIAEYPLDRSGVEHDSIVYYQTMQTVHRKKIFNSVAITDTNESIHIAMKDLTDPQTLPALRSLGIKYVVIHGIPKEKIYTMAGQLRVIESSLPTAYGLTMITAGETDEIVLAEIVDGPRIDSVLTFKKGFVVNLDIMKTAINVEYETLQDTQLQVTPLASKPSHDAVNACFDAKMAARGDEGDLTVSVNGVPQITQRITDTYSTFAVSAKEGDTILLHNSKGYNMRLNNLGCR